MIVNGQPGGGYLVKYGGCEIPFRVHQSERSKLTINVFPEMRVEVLAPSNKSLELILARVNRRAKWIVKQWRYFEQYLPTQPERRFVSGETHVYLGRQYRLKVSRSNQPKVKLSGPYFKVDCSDPDDAEAISKLMNQWYTDHATKLFADRVKHWLSECRWLAKLDVPPIRIRTMKRRWGSCSKSGSIVLNMDLIKVPLNCIDYVIVHELCHLKICNHSPAFYQLLRRCLPDWEAKKKRLEGVAR